MSLNNSPVIALIPARGGSKGVPRKNLRIIAGMPLIEFTVNAALNSRYIDYTYLSSDDDEILLKGESMGVLSVRRPAEFASDTASADIVVNHLFEVLPKQVIKQDPYIVYLQPTSPMRSAWHIDLALEQMEAQHAHTLISVSEMTKSPFKSFSIDASSRLQSIFDEKMSNARRQDLPKAYMPNGAMYIFRISDFLGKGGFPSNGSVPFVMSEVDSIDIDTEEDIRYLEYILREKNG
jgi:CMP-N,N'-diacetyllegionaminic acid synthase